MITSAQADHLVDSLKLLNWATELQQEATTLQQQVQEIYTRTTSGSVAKSEQRVAELTQQLQLLRDIEEGLSKMPDISKMRDIIKPELEALKQVKLEQIWWPELDPKWQAVFKDGNNPVIKGAEPTKDELQDIFQGRLVLYGDNKGLTSLEPLRVCKGLEDLYCGDNQLTSLEPLRALTRLQKLYCQGNQLTSLEPLDGLKSLKELRCHNNPSLSPEEIERFKGERLKKTWPPCEVVY